MATKKLPKVPVPRKPKAARTEEPAAADATPDLTHIAEGLRSLAWPLDQLQFHPENPRRHSSEHVDELAASLKVSGQYKNCVASTRLDPPVMVCGNGTLQAALRLGWTHLAVERKPMTLAQERRLLTIDNITGADPDWDEAMLRTVMADVDTGCDPVLDRMLADLAEDEGVVPPDFQPTTQEEQGRLDQKAATKCPECGHEWTP